MTVYTGRTIQQVLALDYAKKQCFLVCVEQIKGSVRIDFHFLVAKKIVYSVYQDKVA